MESVKSLFRNHSWEEITRMLFTRKEDKVRSCLTKFEHCKFVYEMTSSLPALNRLALEMAVMNATNFKQCKWLLKKDMSNDLRLASLELAIDESTKIKDCLYILKHYKGESEMLESALYKKIRSLLLTFKDCVQLYEGSDTQLLLEIAIEAAAGLMDSRKEAEWVYKVTDKEEIKEKAKKELDELLWKE